MSAALDAKKNVVTAAAGAPNRAVTAGLLPPQVHVFVRDWLSSNNILLKSRDGHVLVDSGYTRHALLTLALLATPRGLGPEPLAQLVNTHCHSDHMGGNAAVAKRYRCPIAVPEGEAPLIANWDQQALLLDYCDQSAERFDVHDVLRAGASYIWGDLEWQALAAPGHDMNALVFFNPEHGILISGDALWENGFGIVMPPSIDPAALPATRATLEMIAHLEVKIVIPGHGEAFTGVARALERAFQRLVAFEADHLRMVRHVLKVILIFHLLDQQRMALAELPEYVMRVPVFRDFNEKFFGLSGADLANALTGELERAGAVRRSDGWLVPA